VIPAPRIIFIAGLTRHHSVWFTSLARTRAARGIDRAARASSSAFASERRSGLGLPGRLRPRAGAPPRALLRGGRREAKSEGRLAQRAGPVPGKPGPLRR